MVPWRLQPQYAKRRGRDQLEKHRGVDKSESSQERRVNSAERTNIPGSTLQEPGHGSNNDDKGCGSDCSIHGPMTHEENLAHLGYQTFHRYYHVFRKGELGDLVHMAIPTANVAEEYYDHENWCVLAEKAP